MGYSTKSCRFAPSRTTYVSVGNYHAYERTDSFSVSVWAKWTSTGMSFTMVGKMGDSPAFRGWSLRAITTGEVHVFLISDHATVNEISVITTSTAFKDGNWHHIAFTYDGSSTAAGVKIYVDNTLQAVTVPANALAGTIVSTDELRLGARVTTGNETYFNGNLDEIAIYDKTLSAAEVAGVWNAGTPNDLSLLGSAANLVGWWRMGDGDTYPTLTDHGSGAHNGTMTSMLSTDIRTDAPPTMRVVDYSTKSCLFNSSTQYAAMGDVLGFEYSDPFSISLWFKSQDTVSGYLLAKRDSTSKGYSMLLKGDLSGVLEFGFSTGSTAAAIRTTTTWNNGVWHHVVGVSTGTGTAAGLSIYVDGVLQTVTTFSDNLSGSILNTANFRVGCREGVTTTTVGMEDEVSVYNKALSAAEVTALYNKGGTNDLRLLVGSDPNLVGWWRMGDGDTYPTLTDWSTGGHNGTMTNMAAWNIQTDAPFPRFMALDHANWRFKANLIQPYSRVSTTFTVASTQYVSLGNVLAFERTDTFSWSFWVKTGASTPAQFVVAKAISGTPEGYAIQISSGGNVFFTLTRVWTTNCISVNTTGQNLRTSTWRHVVVTYDGSSTAAGAKIYVDGALSAMGTTYDNLTDSIVSTADLRFGTRQNGYPAECFGGLLDEISSYNSVLSLAQVQALYNNKAPTNLRAMVSPSPTNLVGWWRMGDGDTAPTITDNSTGGHNGTMVNTPTFTADWPTSGDYNVDYKILLRNLKNALIDGTGWTNSAGVSATLSTPWTVVASSNGVVANTSDNWQMNADIVFADAPTAHSWIILRQTGLISGQNFELCLDCKSSASYILSVLVSYGAGFNTSTLTTARRPPAPDEQGLANDLSWFYGAGSFNAVLNFAVTDDGQCNRFWGFVGGSCKSFWFFDQPKNPVANWTNPVVASTQFTVGPLYTQFNDNAWAAARINGINVWFYVSTEFYNGAAVGQGQTTVNTVTSEWPITRASIACNWSGRYGRHGEMSDMWWTSTTPVAGDTFPATGTLKQFVVVPNMVIPWNQSAPVLT